MLRPKHKRAIYFLLAAASLGINPGAFAQPIDVRLSDLQLLARFEEAVALDVDPAGQLYVVDRGRHSIYKLSPEGEKLQEYGGPGQGEGQFDSPADIDATNGLVLVVADAGNGRIQRFSREFLFLEMLPVGAFDARRNDAFGGEPVYRQRTQDLVGSGEGRPIDVITSSNNDMYAIDEVENVVIKWDKNRNLEQYIGAYDQGAGRLTEPAALALGEDGTLFVGDRKEEAVFLYDAYGGFIRTMAEGLCAEVQSLFTSGEQLYIVLPDKMLHYQTSGMLENTIGVDTDTPLVDAAFLGDSWLLLTQKGLFRAVY